MNADAIALVVAAVVPASIAAVVSVYVARNQSRMQEHQGKMSDRIDATHREVTVNGHVSDVPTLRDLVDSLANKLEDHIHSSEQDRKNLWRAVWWAFRSGRGHAEDTTEYDDN